MYNISMTMRKFLFILGKNLVFCETGVERVKKKVEGVVAQA